MRRSSEGSGSRSEGTASTVDGLPETGSGEENRVGITRHMADGGRVTLDWLRPRQSNVKLASSILKEKKNWPPYTNEIPNGCHG
jgi:hypothetical protein